MLSRDDYRKVKGMSKEEMSRWLDIEHNIMNNNLRKEYEKLYHEEVDSAVANFILAITYTLYFSEDIKLDRDSAASVMEDLFVTVDMFRKGEYKPEDYIKQLKEQGVTIEEYDYDRLYKKVEQAYQVRLTDRNTTIQMAKSWINSKMTTTDTNMEISTLEELNKILKGG